MRYSPDFKGFAVFRWLLGFWPVQTPPSKPRHSTRKRDDLTVEMVREATRKRVRAYRDRKAGRI